MKIAKSKMLSLCQKLIYSVSNMSMQMFNVSYVYIKYPIVPKNMERVEFSYKHFLSNMYNYKSQ